MGLFDLASDNPDFWQGSTEKSPNSAVLGSDNVLAEDFCIIDGQHYFVRCVLELVWQGDRFWRLGHAVQKELCCLLREFRQRPTRDVGTMVRLVLEPPKGLP